MKNKIATTLYISLVTVFLFSLGNAVLALAPTNDISVLGDIAPIIHIGAGAQSILGPVLLGDLNGVGGSLQVRSGTANNPRPSVFSSAKSDLIQSIFTVLQSSLLLGRSLSALVRALTLVNQLQHFPLLMNGRSK